MLILRPACYAFDIRYAAKQAPKGRKETAQAAGPGWRTVSESPEGATELIPYIPFINRNANLRHQRPVFLLKTHLAVTFLLVFDTSQCC